jgi:hypothetical protein
VDLSAACVVQVQDFPVLVGGLPPAASARRDDDMRANRGRVGAMTQHQVGTCRWGTKHEARRLVNCGAGAAATDAPDDAAPSSSDDWARTWRSDASARDGNVSSIATDLFATPETCRFDNSRFTSQIRRALSVPNVDGRLALGFSVGPPHSMRPFAPSIIHHLIAFPKDLVSFSFHFGMTIPMSWCATWPKTMRARRPPQPG